MNLVLLDIGEFNFLLYLKTEESSLNDKDVNLLPSLPSPDVTGEEATESVEQQGIDLASSAVITISVYSRLLEKSVGDLVNIVDNARDDEGNVVTQEKVESIRRTRSARDIYRSINTESGTSFVHERCAKG